ncbi:MAG TPA: hypothetical protein ENK26_06760, partial [Gammaproteobacteria bacterium]|nr:hypothetical protein [Gammaproteobacteria bacterium]
MSISMRAACGRSHVVLIQPCPNPFLALAPSRQFTTMSARALLSAFLVIAAAPLLADSLDEIEVTSATPGERTGEVVLSEHTGSVSIVPSATLTRPGATLARVLSRETGVQVRQAGGLGSFSSATLRGSSSDQVMVYLDGLLLNDTSGGG